MKICIDPGHGGKDPGAVGPAGTKEKDVTLDYSFHLRNLLLLGYKCFITRQDDSFVGLSNRAYYANEKGADIFISLHCNGFKNPSAHGFEIYTYRGQSSADPLATAIYDSVKREFDDVKLRNDFSDGDPDKEAGYTVLRKTSMPAVLIELGFITNPEEEKKLVSFSFRARMCQAIVNGIDDYVLGR